MAVASREYEAISEARELGRCRLRPRTAKVLSLLGVTGALALVLAVVRPRTPWGRTAVQMQSGETLYAENEYQKQCMFTMRTTGCNKKNAPKNDVWWSCEKTDWSKEYKCCCEEDQGWPHAQLQQLGWLKPDGGSSGSSVSMLSPSAVEDILDEGSDALLQFVKMTKMCLRGPEETGGLFFTIWDCDDGQPDTRFQLPERGAGSIKWSSKPGVCLGLVNGDTEVQAVPCQPGNMKQMFQLTEGNAGMIQWSHGGNQCLDVEDDKITQGKKIVIADCVYWPKKDTQQFKVVAAPKKVPKKERKEEVEDQESPVSDEEEEDEEEADDADKKPLKPPGLFCVSLMLPWTYERDMLQSHAKHGAGIFQCDDFAVYSSKRVKIIGGSNPYYSDIMNGTLKAKIGGAYHTALNTPIFLRFWKRVIVDEKAWRNDWIAKVDPDAVFFPSRLKIILKNRWAPHGRPDAAIWLQNCQLGLHGPLEVFTKQALGVYNKRQDECAEVADEIGQEDKFLGHCFQKLGLKKVNAFNILLEWAWACNERPSARKNLPPCYDPQVSFHPFKSVETYWKCYKKANMTKFPESTWMAGQEPSESNHHHA